MNQIAISGGRSRGIMPATFEDVQRIAKMAVASGLFKGDRKDNETEKTAKATMAIMQGLEVGLPPMQAVQCIAVINGRCLIWGDAVPGLLWANGFKVKQWIDGIGDQRTAFCTITRPDGEQITRSFSVAEAKRARLWDDRQTIKKQWDGKWEEKPNDSPWFRFPDRMLGYRALGFCQKDGASDVTRGLYIREEYDANEVLDITPAKAVATPALELPDIPDIPEEPTDELLPDPDAFLENLQSQLAACENEQELAEVKEANTPLRARLLPAHQYKMDVLYGEYQ